MGVEAMLDTLSSAEVTEWAEEFRLRETSKRTPANLIAEMQGGG